MPEKEQKVMFVVLSPKYADLTQRAIHVQKTIIRKLADRESCVIIGRSADYILKEQKPIFANFSFILRKMFESKNVMKKP